MVLAAAGRGRSYPRCAAARRGNIASGFIDVATPDELTGAMAYRTLTRNTSGVGANRLGEKRRQALAISAMSAGIDLSLSYIDASPRCIAWLHG